MKKKWGIIDYLVIAISYLLDRKRKMDSFIWIDHFIDINIFDK